MIIENRLFRVIREQQGLVYSINFQSGHFEQYNGGMAVVLFQPHPSAVDYTIAEVSAESAFEPTLR